MKKVKVVLIILTILLIIGGITAGTILYIQQSKSLKAAEEQVVSLESKLNAIGYFTDVFTVKVPVEMGQEIKESDISPLSVPVDTVPKNVITDKTKLIGKYWRIGVQPGTTISSDLVVDAGYTGTTYKRELHLDASIPVGCIVGDYLDVRIVLPGGEEFVVFAHKRIDAKYENTVVMEFDEADLWLYTSMMIDRSLYKKAGLKLYATKYVDPGSHNKTVAYYPIRKEAVDIMSVAPNLTETQRNRLWNESLRNAIDKKLDFYSTPGNADAALIAAGVSEEEARSDAAKVYFETLLKEMQSNAAINSEGTGTSTNTDNTGTGTGTTTTPTGSNTGTTGTPTTDGAKDANGNSSVVTKDEKITNLGEDLMGDETPIK